MDQKEMETDVTCHPKPKCLRSRDLADGARSLKMVKQGKIVGVTATPLK